ncbi:MAG: hypothetical protein WAQ28_07580 [Bacteroidia bacterium]
MIRKPASDKFKEIKIYSSEGKEDSTLRWHYYFNNSGLVYKSIFLYNGQDTSEVEYITYDSLNRWKNKTGFTKYDTILRTYSIDYSYPNQKTRIAILTDNGKRYKSKLKTYKLKNKEVRVLLKNGKLLSVEKTKRNKNIIYSKKKYKNKTKKGGTTTTIVKTKEFLDQQNNITQANCRQYSKVNGFSKWTISYTYDTENKKRTSCILHSYESGNTTNCSYYEYIY